MADVRITFAFPTTREDGKSLPASQIAHVVVLMSADGGQNFSEMDRVTVPEFVQTELESGTYVFRFVVVDTQRVPKSSQPHDETVNVDVAAPGKISDVVVVIT